MTDTTKETIVTAISFAWGIFWWTVGLSMLLAIVIAVIGTVLTALG